MSQYDTVTISLVEYNNLLKARELLSEKYGIWMGNYTDITNNIYIFPKKDDFINALHQDIKNLIWKLEAKDEKIRDLERNNSRESTSSIFNFNRHKRP